jgi:hypothetical protein
MLKISFYKFSGPGWFCYYTVQDTDVGASPHVCDHPTKALNAVYKDIEARMTAGPNALLDILKVASTPINEPVPALFRGPFIFPIITGDRK